MKRFLLTLTVLLSMGAFGSAQEWLTDYSKALEKAKIHNQPILINFTGSDWCLGCIYLQREVFATPEFKVYAGKNLVLLKIDFPKRRTLSPEQKKHNDDLAKRFDVEGYPTIVVLRSDGTKIGALVGFQPGGPKQFIETLERVMAGKTVK